MKALPAGNSLCSTQKNEELSVTDRQLTRFFFFFCETELVPPLIMIIHVLSSTRYEIISPEGRNLGYL
jgi:hypothetical protein